MQVGASIAWLCLFLLPSKKPRELGNLVRRKGDARSVTHGRHYWGCEKFVSSTVYIAEYGDVLLKRELPRRPLGPSLSQMLGTVQKFSPVGIPIPP